MRSGARAEFRAPSSRLLARLPSIVRFAHSAFAPFSYFPLFPNKGRYVTKKPLFRDDSGKRISLQVNTSRIMPGQGTVCANGCPFRTTRHLLICYKPLFFGNIAQMRDGDRADAHEKGKRGEGRAKTKEQGGQRGKGEEEGRKEEERNGRVNRWDERGLRAKPGGRRGKTSKQVKQKEGHAQSQEKRGEKSR